MDKAARIRWAILLSTLAATVAAVFYPGANDAGVEVSAAAPRLPPAAKALVSVAADAVAIDAEESSDVDPFAPRGWQAPPPPAAPPPAAPLVVAAVDLTPPGPPALPFRFVGSMNDNLEQVVYLARGDQALVARTGEVLDTEYKVVAINAQQIEFEYIPTGARQALVFPARDN
ncbi:hypothetical protein HUX88_03195 [Duganella sp. BJB1802]|uniref:hypothetical protein n=1 Tax=Duganella sp. BJB1802 TaxID=2744575 RepID=UPI0015945524|nr:hypothetical protein [Duganella sp. BJB1802]NVD69563.1 hypothetical protein [Duganella sp. BJB1802]